MKNLSVIALVGAMFMATGCAKDDANGGKADISTKIEDANFRKYCISNFDLNKDGKISKDEAAMVETINVVSDRSIYSIKGVETFPNLKNLSVENQKLESVDISSLNLSYFSFKGCTNLKSINLNGNTASIGNCAFDGCTNLRDVVIPESVTVIGYRAFFECVNIKNIRIPDNVKKIEGSAFYGCTGLTAIAIPDSTTSLGDYVFADCTNLSDIALGNGIYNIGHSAFAGCSGLTDITIPSSVVNIEGAAFSECSFTNVEIPEGVKSIGSGVFAHCNKLTSVTIPASVTSIIGGLFVGCSNIIDIYCPDFAKWCEIEFSSSTLNNRVNLYLNGQLVAGDTVIPNGVTKIGDFAFSDYRALTSVTVPDSVTSIGRFAFGNCSALTSVTVGSGVEEIGNSAFDGCSNLSGVFIGDVAKWCAVKFGNVTSNPLCYAGKLYLNSELVTDLVIPDSVTSIGGYTFYNCSALTSVTIGSGVEKIGTETFGNSRNLTNIYCKPTTPPTLGLNVFYNISTSAKIYVPRASVNSYKYASGWSSYALKITGYDF